MLRPLYNYYCCDLCIVATSVGFAGDDGRASDARAVSAERAGGSAGGGADTPEVPAVPRLLHAGHLHAAHGHGRRVLEHCLETP